MFSACLLYRTVAYLYRPPLFSVRPRQVVDPPKDFFRTNSHFRCEERLPERASSAQDTKRLYVRLQAPPHEPTYSSQS